MDTLDIGPGKGWTFLLWVPRILFGLFAAVFVWAALFAPDGGWGMLAIGLASAALVWFAPRWMARWEPHVVLSPEGVRGPGVPDPVSWGDIRDVEVRLIPARGRQPEHNYVMLDVPDADAYVARMSRARRAALATYKLYRLKPLSLQVTNVSKSPDEIAALVRERAAYVGSSSDGTP